MSYSNNYIVAFENVPVSYPGLSEEIEYFCDEAQLPNINTSTGSVNGLYTGLGNIDYPHTKVFTELQLGFMLDADLSVLKFMNAWYDSMFEETGTADNRTVRVKYRSEYAGRVKITKSETGPESATQRKPITYILEQAYPYAIDSIPLQFGSTQVTKVTAQFKYQRHYTVNRSIRDVKSGNIPAGGVLVGEAQVSPGVYEQQWLLPNGKIVTKSGNKNATGTLPTAR